MAKGIHLLTDLRIKKSKSGQTLNDGGGLYLQVRKSGTKDWFYRYEFEGNGRKKGLGSYSTISLQNAREQAQNCRLLRNRGIDPIHHSKQQKKEAKTQSQIKEAKSKTFKLCALEYIESRKVEWTNAKHQYQWTQSLEHYAFPVFGDLPVQEINTGLVVDALKAIWTTKTETATRVRQRIEAILDYAKTLNYRAGENPARWKGHLDKVLSSPNKVRKVIHHPAMPYIEIPAYYQEIAKKQTIGGLALSFQILSATRSGEARGATWEEIDLKNDIWNISSERMKTRRPFRVPLTPEARRILKAAKPFKQNGFIFPGLSGAKPISDTAVRSILKETHPKLTVHGFRSTFRDWCAEQTNFPREVAESALAHALENKTEAAYQRGDLILKRRKLMESWSKYLTVRSNSKVVPIRKKKNG
jgi:integrase